MLSSAKLLSLGGISASTNCEEALRWGWVAGWLLQKLDVCGRGRRDVGWRARQRGRMQAERASERRDPAEGCGVVPSYKWKMGKPIRFLLSS